MSKDIIGLKQADGSFYPILKRGTPSKKRLQVTTSKDNQTTVQINLYCASDNSFSDAEFLDTLKIDGLVPHEKKNHQIDLILSLDENDNLSADLNDKESGKTAQKPVNFAPVTRQVPKDISSEIAAFNEKNLEKGDFDPLSAVAQTAAAAGVAFSGMPNTDYATGFANDPLFAGETKIENKENPEDVENFESSELPESAENEESENNAPVDESFADFAEQSDLGDAATETESAENDLIENTELPDFDDTFAAAETESESEELPDFSDGFTAENDLIENEELPDFADDFAAEITEPAESEITKNDETETEPDGDIFESDPAESAENTEENFDNSFTGDDLSSFGDLPDFADDEANAAPEESAETEEAENNALADESFADFAEQGDSGDAATETESAENDLIENTELPDFDDTFAAAETESEELPDFGGDFTAESGLIENSELPDFADDFAAESTEPAESEITENSEIETEPSDDIFESEPAESAENTEENFDNSFTGDDLSSFGDLPDFANLETNAAPEESTETEEAENNASADESFADFAEQSDLGDAVTETESAESDFIENTELPDFDDTFAAHETESESEELPDFADLEANAAPEESTEAESIAPADESFDDFVEQSDLGDTATETESTESDLIENTELPDFDDTFAADETESESEDLPDFSDDEANNFAEDDSANEASTDSYFDEAAAVAAMASAGAMGFAAGAASGTGETSDENFVNDGDDDDFSLDDFSDLDADFEMPNEEALAELDKEIDEINMNFSNQTALNEANSFADYFSEDSTYDDLADSYNSSYAAENGITNFDFLNDKSSRPKLPLVPLVCVLCAVISIASCFVIWLLFLNNKNAPVPVVAETAVTKEYQGVSVLKEDPAKSESTASQLEKAMAQENSIIIIDAPIVIPIPVVPVVNQEETKRYQIKRGDTLWDIADSFYKNPWMYEKIAKANRIKNPDYILSGTWIEIPPM